MVVHSKEGAGIPGLGEKNAATASSVPLSNSTLDDLKEPMEMTRLLGFRQELLNKVFDTNPHSDADEIFDNYRENVNKQLRVLGALHLANSKEELSEEKLDELREASYKSAIDGIMANVSHMQVKPHSANAIRKATYIVGLLANEMKDKDMALNAINAYKLSELPESMAHYFSKNVLPLLAPRLSDAKRV